MQRLALLSVSDKTGIVELARALANEFGFELVASGGTARTLEQAGLTVTLVSAHTGAAEILNGRVKTLHPAIHGGILARRDDPQDRQELETHGIRPIDLVAVNLYPFERAIAQPGASEEQAIEYIDIGGPTLLRAAAKNHAHLTVLCEPERYGAYLQELRATAGSPSHAFRRARAAEAFAQTAAYDRAIAAYFQQQAADGTALPTQWGWAGTQQKALRYGENPHQSAAWYRTGATQAGWAAATQLQGKALSYNNLVDLEAARGAIAEFARASEPAAVVVKHTNPCGIALGETLEQAYERAFNADSVSAFGGIVALNRAIDVATARQLTGTFLECVVAPGSEPAAREVLAQKSKLRVLLLPELDCGPSHTVKAIAGGFLAQSADAPGPDPGDWQAVTERAPSDSQWAEMAFAWRAVKHLKSNAIAITCNRVTLGMGAGQMNRVGAARLALEQAGDRAQGATLASDGFFPFDDTVRLAAEAGVEAIIQPGGSQRDRDAIQAADEGGLAMVLTGVRHFLH